ncbi:hypothetical protein [Methanosarcina mazei]|uniref:hypothetical protein n=1 Tax=Methanosarcina mazei TaxID=2209 RepID=UPI001E5273AB|nr:hypothetical protein [Methanosarcina mazei]
MITIPYFANLDIAADTVDLSRPVISETSVILRGDFKTEKTCRGEGVKSSSNGSLGNSRKISSRDFECKEFERRMYTCFPFFSLSTKPSLSRELTAFDTVE